ncbi:hypothetical protein NM688_g6319 [Phlebia brevispora]|uniref:Uncharacterized protein n=1 Tax=Phlebia brevispora TaxID=194682 RepID=A0ACC1SHE2_9APHY|nr:hypothetical protein NM688_g6319 [Phlebia brevispora]
MHLRAVATVILFTIRIASATPQPDAPMRQGNLVLDASQRTAFEKNIGCIQGACGPSNTTKTIMNAEVTSGASPQIAHSWEAWTIAANSLSVAGSIIALLA